MSPEKTTAKCKEKGSKRTHAPKAKLSWQCLHTMVANGLESCMFDQRVAKQTDFSLQSASTISALSHKRRHISSASFRLRAWSLSKLCPPASKSFSSRLVLPRPASFSKLTRDLREPAPSVSTLLSLKLVLRLLAPVVKPFALCDDLGMRVLRDMPGVWYIRARASAIGLRYLRTTLYSTATWLNCCCRRGSKRPSPLPL